MHVHTQTHQRSASSHSTDGPCVVEQDGAQTCRRQLTCVFFAGDDAMWDRALQKSHDQASRELVAYQTALQEYRAQGGEASFAYRPLYSPPPILSEMENDRKGVGEGVAPEADERARAEWIERERVRERETQHAIELEDRERARAREELQQLEQKEKAQEAVEREVLSSEQWAVPAESARETQQRQKVALASPKQRLSSPDLAGSSHPGADIGLAARLAEAPPVRILSAQEREQHAARVGLPDEGAGLQHTHDRKRGHREEAFVSGVSAPSRRDASALDVLSALTFHHQPPPPPEPAEIPTPQLSCVSKASPPHRASPPPALPQPASPQSLSVSVRPPSMSKSDVCVQHNTAVTREGTGMAAAHMRASPRGEKRGVGAGSSGGTDVYIQRASVQASIAAASQAAIRASAPSPRSQTGQNSLSPAMTAGHDLSALGWAAAAGEEGINNPLVSRLMSEARERFARFQVCVWVCARLNTHTHTHTHTHAHARARHVKTRAQCVAFPWSHVDSLR